MNDEIGKTEGGGQATGFDIPDNELTPSVQAALCRIIEEIDLLRADIERSQSRIVYLEELADSDPLASVSNRRALRASWSGPTPTPVATVRRAA